MFETYRMLGSERESELLREAQRLHVGRAQRVQRRFARVVRLAGWLTVRSDDRTERRREAREAESRATLESAGLPERRPEVRPGVEGHA